LTYLIGIDIGTTGTKVLVVSPDGTETKLGGAYDHFADGGA
jgi:sugar (pentulose or hexulose) kinase